MEEKLKKEIEEVLKDLGAGNPNVSFDMPENLRFGDLSTNTALVYGKILRKKPVDLANELKEALLSKDILHLSRVDVIEPGFINFFFDRDYFAKMADEILDKGPVFQTPGKSTKVFIEHSQPNPFKEFHIGHLMNNAIGESLSRIIKTSGAEVKTCSYHGDVGMHVAKAVWALSKGVSFEEAYAHGNKAYEEDESAQKEIVEINKKIYEKSDTGVSKLYEEGRKKSLEYFDFIYKKLGSHFDYSFYESETGDTGKKIVEENTGKVFEKGENGAVIFKGENFGLHTRVFLNSDGLPTYEAKEVGLARMKKEKFSFDLSLTVTANEQDSFFNVVEVAIGEVFPDLKGKLKHISHGMMKLPDGKMSSRTGNIISAESLIAQVKEKVLEKMKDREMSQESKSDIAEAVGIGAIKYSILKQAVGSDIIFDFDKSISFEGDSGPYLQYATVRANSLLVKAKDAGISPDTKLPENWQTSDLERVISRYPEMVNRACMEYAPNKLATYLIDLSGEFNSFYAGGKIIDKTDPTSPYRVALTDSFTRIMASGLELLGIKIPPQM